MLEIKQYNLNRKQRKFLRELGTLADKSNLSMVETWQVTAHYTSFIKESHDKGLVKLEEKGYIKFKGNDKE